MLLDRAVLPLGRMELLPDCEGAAGTDGDGGSPDGADAGPEFVRMDASALENLEVPWLGIRLCAGQPRVLPLNHQASGSTHESGGCGRQDGR